MEISWRQLATERSATTTVHDHPGPRRHHSGCRHGDRLIVFGGMRNKETILSDLWALPLLSESQLASDPIWECLGSAEQASSTTATEWPPARSGHSAVCLGSKMLVFGGLGQDRFTALQDFWQYDFESGIWTRLADGPGPRYHHAALVQSNDRMLIHGGSVTLKLYQADLWQYCLVTGSWSLLDAGHSLSEPGMEGPGPIAGHILFQPDSALANEVVWLYGGYTGDCGFTPRSRLYQFRFQDSERGPAGWTRADGDGADSDSGTDPLSYSPLPNRPLVSCSWRGLEWVFGGYDGNRPLGTVHAFRPKEKRWCMADLWREIDVATLAAAGRRPSQFQSLANSHPVPRYGHCAIVWEPEPDRTSGEDGDQGNEAVLLVYGGSGSLYLDDLFMVRLLDN